MTTSQQAMLMPMTICVIIPGLKGYPSFMGFHTTHYTYALTPISPDLENKRQLQQLLNRAASTGEVNVPGVARGAGLAEKGNLVGVPTLMVSRGRDR